MAALGRVVHFEHRARRAAAAGRRSGGATAGGFDIDGNLLANTPTANIGDWVSNTNLAPGTGGGVLSITGVPLDPTRTFHFVDPYNDTGNDRIFAGGNKWIDNPDTPGAGPPASPPPRRTSTTRCYT